MAAGPDICYSPPSSPPFSPPAAHSLAPPTPHSADLLSPVATDHPSSATPSPAEVLTPHDTAFRADRSQTPVPSLALLTTPTKLPNTPLPSSITAYSGLLSPLPDRTSSNGSDSVSTDFSGNGAITGRKRSYSFLRTEDGSYLGTYPGRTIYSAGKENKQDTQLQEITGEATLDLVVEVKGSKYFPRVANDVGPALLPRTGNIATIPSPPSPKSPAAPTALGKPLDLSSTESVDPPRVTPGSPSEDDRPIKRTRVSLDAVTSDDSDTPSPQDISPTPSPPAPSSAPAVRPDQYTPPPPRLRLVLRAPPTPGGGKVVPPYVGIPSPTQQREVRALADNLLAPITIPPRKHVPNIHPALEFTPGKRGIKIRANQPIKKGTTLMAANPLFNTLHSRLLGTHCSGCFQTPSQKALLESKDAAVVKKGYLVCHRCDTMIFCSLKCYVKNAARHFPECRAFSRLTDGELPRTIVHLVAKLLWTQYSTGKKVSLPDFTLPTSLSRDLKQTHIDVNDICRLISKEGDALDIAWARFQLDEGRASVKKILQKVKALLFPLRDYASNNIGLCIQPGLAHFEHSCCPDAIVTWPYGPGIDRPMRIVLLDQRWGGEPLRINYVEPDTPYRQRSGLLGMQGFQHNCMLCMRTDIRWMAKHQDCEMEGDVSLWTEHNEKCSGCGKEARVDLSETPYYESSIRVSASIKAEREGQFGSVLNNALDEASLITVELSTLLDFFPDTVFPIPHLQRRLARFLMRMPPSITRVQQAIEQYETAIGAWKDLNEGDWSPTVMALLTERIEAQLKMIINIMDGEYQEDWRVSPRDRRKANLLWERRKNRLLTEGIKQLVSVTNEAMVDSEQMGGSVLAVKARRYYERTRELFKMLNLGKDLQD